MGGRGWGLGGLGGLVLALALAGAPPAALGQGHYDGADIREEKPFGSRLRRTYVTGAAPARTYSRLDILNSGAFTLGQFLQRLPGQGSGANQRHLDSDGSVRMDFHHLGAERTLVLVNGRRWANGGRGADASPDLDAIPLAMVQRVEVLTGSASAVYGSGAMGGAINIVTREGGEGLDFRLQTGSYTAGGASGDSYQLTWGSTARSGRTSLMVGAAVQNGGQVLASARSDAAAAPLQGLYATPQGNFRYVESQDRGGLTDQHDRERRFLLRVPVIFTADNFFPDDVNRGTFQARMDEATPITWEDRTADPANPETRFSELRYSSDADIATPFGCHFSYALNEEGTLPPQDERVEKVYTLTEWEGLTETQQNLLEATDIYRPGSEFTGGQCHANDLQSPLRVREYRVDMAEDGTRITNAGFEVEKDETDGMYRGIHVEEDEETGTSTTHYVDETGRRVNRMGQLIDEDEMPVDVNGYRINADNIPLDADGNPLPSVGDDPIRIDDMGRRINDMGMLIDDMGMLINEDGMLVNADGHLVDDMNRLVNADGMLVDDMNRVIDDMDRLVNADGMLVNADGHLVDNMDRLVNADGNLVDADGNLVDADGDPIAVGGDPVAGGPTAGGSTAGGPTAGGPRTSAARGGVRPAPVAAPDRGFMQYYKGHIIRVVTRPDPPLLLNFVDSGQNDVFGDPETWCNDAPPPAPDEGEDEDSSAAAAEQPLAREGEVGVTLKDGGGVDSDSGSGDYYQAGSEGAANFRCWDTASDRYNPNPHNTLVAPVERSSAFVSFSHRFHDALRFRVEASTQDKTTSQQRAPAVLVWGDETGEHIAHDQLYNPFDLQLCPIVQRRPGATDAGGNICAHPDDIVTDNSDPADPVRTLAATPGHTLWGTLERSLQEMGARVWQQETESSRLAVSLEGDLAEGWSYALHWQQSQNQLTETQTGHLDSRNLALALGDSAACTGECRPLNLFGGQGANAAGQAGAGAGGGSWSGDGSITRQMLDYIAFTAANSGENSLDSMTLDITGRLANLHGGPLSLALGVETRSETGFLLLDPRVAEGHSQGVDARSVQGSQDVTALYAEVAVPWIGSVDLGLESQFSLSLEDYSTFGNRLSHSLLTRLTLGDQFVLRASHTGGFRAPSLTELYLGEAQASQLVVDPCDSSAATFTGNATTGEQNTEGPCDVGVAGGVPDGFVPRTDRATVVWGGNAGLQPEKSTSLGLGFLFVPSVNFEFSVDYFETEVDSIIGRLGAQQILDACYEVAGVERPESFCGLVERETAGPEGAVGHIRQVRDSYTNSGTLATRGFDVGIHWKHLVSPAGIFDVSLDLYLMDALRFFPTHTAGYDARALIDAAGARNFSSHRLRLSGDWRRGPLSANLSLQQLGNAGGYADLPPSGVRERQGPVRYLDGWVRYRLGIGGAGRSSGLALTLGFANLLDQDPPRLGQAGYSNYDPSYRAHGSQTFYLGLQGQF